MLCIDVFVTLTNFTFGSVFAGVKEGSGFLISSDTVSLGHSYTKSVSPVECTAPPDLLLHVFPLPLMLASSPPVTIIPPPPLSHTDEVDPSPSPSRCNNDTFLCSDLQRRVTLPSSLSAEQSENGACDILPLSKILICSPLCYEFGPHPASQRTMPHSKPFRLISSMSIPTISCSLEQPFQRYKWISFQMFLYNEQVSM
ncbi:hypothetical protein DY000_02061401 [Brassica cretica]|uniref:Uncharacterized protein n=1 Tax=Brassica cretica TaxID=69181 RepID=A0ABQ7ARZ4_BRACR|nr:hypothetical protein DY000_02061401 [Brassica cretica]